MDDLISREAAIEIAERYGCNNGSSLGRHSGVADCIASEIDTLSAVDAAPVVHGRWLIRESGPSEIECKCSVCKYRDFVPRNDVYWINRKFCPNCGAKMDGERRDDDALSGR